MNKLAFGLNPRNATTKAPSRKRKGLSGFDTDSGSDTNEDAPAITGRQSTNAAIAAEQAALRKRAEASLQSYDYDGQYDSFTKNKAPEPKKSNEDKSSKYISRLLESSKRRTREQEIVYEKKIAKEQAMEEEEMQYEGKERFITSAYKRKLAEREEWMKEEKERERLEKEEDVTKRKVGGFLFAGIGRSLLNSGSSSGAADGVKSDVEIDEKERNDGKSDNERHGDSSIETERWGHTHRSRPRDHASRQYNQMNYAAGSTTLTNNDSRSDPSENVPVKSRKQILEERAIKIREARKRYFQRKGLELGQ
jgi:coiled-coil domain-containing protein 55